MKKKNELTNLVETMWVANLSRVLTWLVYRHIHRFVGDFLLYVQFHDHFYFVNSHVKGHLCKQQNASVALGTVRECQQKFEDNFC